MISLTVKHMGGWLVLQPLAQDRGRMASIIHHKFCTAVSANKKLKIKKDDVV